MSKLTASMIKEGSILLHNRTQRYYVCISSNQNGLSLCRETDYKLGSFYDAADFDASYSEDYTLTEYKVNLGKLYASRWTQINKDIDGNLVAMGDIVAFTEQSFKSFPELKSFMEENKITENEFVVTMMRGINHVRGAFHLQLESHKCELSGKVPNRAVRGTSIYGWWAPHNVRVIR